MHCEGVRVAALLARSLEMLQFKAGMLSVEFGTSCVQAGQAG